MVCSNPILINCPGFPDRASSLVRGQEKPYMYGTMVVPCGKCMACIRRRQDDYAFRIRSEAEKRGSLVFMTLTYSDDHLPLVSTLWRCDKSTGESERISDPEYVCYSGREDFYDFRSDFRSMRPSSKPRYKDFDVFEDDEYKYFTRMTPSVCRKDVQNWLKQVRHHFERKLCRRLDFSYSICSEYGSKFCRPHYHCCFMGLSLEDAQIAASLWKYGFTKTDFIKHDNFENVASYIGKYVSKGDFRCDSEKDCTAFPCRQMNSKALGESVVAKFRNYVLCFDMVGEFDPDTLFSKSRQHYLNRQELSLLVSEVPKRLSVSYDGKRYYAIPRILRNKIFYVTKKSEDGSKIYSRPSKLWRMVVRHLQDLHAELDSREFAQLLSNKTPRKAAQDIASFYLESETFAASAEAVRKENYRSRLQSSVF